MSLRINLNSAALTAHRMLAQTDTALGKTIERLSSGFKINSAADDPAGLVISEKLRAQVSGLNQAISNAGDAVNMVKTAEGALSQVSSLLTSMRDLAVHAANTGATDPASAQADQAQIRSALDSINKIGSETQFGNKKLLDGTAGLTAQITGTSVVAADISKANITTSLVGVTITVTQVATKASLAAGTVDISGDMSGNTITINGVQIQGGTNGANTIANINAKSSQTGVVASLSGNNLKLDQLNYGSDQKIIVTGGTAILGSATASAIGQDVQAQVRNGVNNISDATWASGDGTVLRDSLGNAIQLTDVAASTGPPPSALGAQFDVTAGTLTFQLGAYAGQTRSLNIAAVAASQLGLANGTTVTSLANIDVTLDAQSAIKVLDKAISDVSSLRANLGAVQTNVLESSISSLTIAQENIAASESTIRDTDMASEMVELTKNQILEQAGTAMLAQANQAPQTLLKLLQG